jgi:diguanylate cyclase (GGDEF)-like protein
MTRRSRKDGTAGGGRSRRDGLAASAALAAGFGGVYLALAELGHLLSFPDAGFATLWPPGALYFTVLVRRQPARWPVLLLSALIANLVSDVGLHGRPLLVGLAVWTGNSLEAATAAWLLQRREGMGFSFQTLGEAYSFLALAVLLCPLLGATVGAATVAAAFSAPFEPAWLVWWIGDALGMLIVTPVLLSWFGEHLPRIRSTRPLRFVELSAALVLLTLTAQKVFADPRLPGSPYLRFTYWAFPFLVWISARFDLRAASMGPLIIGLVAVLNTTAGNGPFAAEGSSVSHQAVLLQTYLGVAALITLHLSVGNAENARIRRSLALKQRELEEANARLETLAETDPLTALKNRRAFEATLDREFAFSSRTGAPLSLMMLDLDRFKKYNDLLGHPAGDEVLKTIATLMLRSVRHADFAARYGGEEFIVLLPGTDQAGSITMAERLRSTIEEHPWSPRPVTASLGIATFLIGKAEDCTSPEELIARADTALYYAKATGRNRAVHAEDMLEEVREASDTGTITLPG